MTAYVDFLRKKCGPCEGNGVAMSRAEAEEYLKFFKGWNLSEDAASIEKIYSMKDFMAAVEAIRSIAEIAEREGHHPDLFLTGYRNLKIHLMTHAIGGLSENDFILAAKIEELPKKLK